MAAPTLAQALTASLLVDMINSSLNSLGAQLTAAQAQVLTIQTMNLASALTTAQNQVTAIQGAIAAEQAGLTSNVATINAYNAANPGATIPIG